MEAIDAREDDFSLDRPKASLTMVDLAATPLDPPEADLCGLGYTGKINLFVGAPESMKTWAALIVAKHQIDQGNVVAWLDFEDDARTMKERTTVLDIDLNRFAYFTPMDAFDGVGATVLGDGCSLVVIDSMAGFMGIHGLNGDSREDVEVAYRFIRTWFTSRGAGVIVLDHVVKSAEGTRWATGSERKISGLDGAGVSFTKKVDFGRGRTGESTLSVIKDRPGVLRSTMATSLVLTEANGVVSYDFTGGAGSLHDEVVAYLRTNPSQSTNQICQAITGRSEAIKDVLAELTAGGRLAATRGPRNGIYYSVVA